MVRPGPFRDTHMSGYLHAHNTRMSDCLKPGDIVECKWIGDMTHWGVYIGNNKVVHLTVSRSFESKFHRNEKGLVDFVYLDNEKYQWRKNNDKDKDYRPSPVQEIIERANAALAKGKSEYNLVFYNCEHFASFCRYGVKQSYQVLHAQGIAAGVVLGACPQLREWVKSDETQRTCTTPEFQALLNQAISEIEEFFKHKEQSGEPSSFAKGFPSVGLRTAASTMIPTAKFVSALGPHGRHCHLGLDFLKIPLTKRQRREWMADCASALKNFLKTSPSLHERGIGAILGLFLAVTTTESCIKWSIEAADIAAFFAHLLPQKSHIEQLMSVVKSMLTSLDGKEGFNMHLSIAATVLGLFPLTKVLGVAVDVFRTIKYELPGKGYIEGAVCLVKCVVRNVDVVPFVSTGVKWIGSWFGW